MHKDLTAEEYLQIVMDSWSAFCKSHSPLENAIKFIKAENEKQKAQINELLSYISNIEEYYNGDFIREFTDKIMYQIINSNTKISSGAGPEYYKGAAARQNEIIKIICSLLPEKESSNNGA